MVQQVTFARSDAGIGQRPVNFERLRLYPLTILPIKSFLRDLADVNLGVEVGGKGFVVVSCVAIDDIQVLNFVEVVLCGVGREDGGHARVETAAENGTKSGFLEAITISPLPRVLKMRLILRFVVSGVEIVAAGLETSLHDGEILVGQSQVHDQLRLEVIEEANELLHIVGIYLRGANIVAQPHVGNALGNRLTLGFCAAGDHDFVEDIAIFCDFDSGHGGNAAGADDEYFSHCVCVS